MDSGQDQSLTVIFTHFGDEFWIRHSLAKLVETPGGYVKKIYVIDQNHGLEPINLVLHSQVEVVRFGPYKDWIERLGHDHPAVLQAAINNLEISTSHCLILDSDCFPIKETWVDWIHAGRSVLAGDPRKTGLTHPCFMLILADQLHLLDFGAGIMNGDSDTGRLIGQQLVAAGKNPLVLDAKSSPWGKGDLYGKAIYHHGSGSIWTPRRPNSLHEKVMIGMESHLRDKISSGSMKFQFSDLRLLPMRAIALITAVLKI